MRQSTFIDLIDDDNIRRVSHSPTTIYIGDYLTISGTRASYEKLAAAVTSILIDTLVPTSVGGDS